MFIRQITDGPNVLKILIVGKFVTPRNMIKEKEENSSSIKCTTLVLSVFIIDGLMLKWRP